MKRPKRGQVEKKKWLRIEGLRLEDLRSGFRSEVNTEVNSADQQK